MYAAHTKLCGSLEHLYQIQLAVKPWQEDADVSSILNNRLNGVPVCVFFARCWTWVVEWDPGVLKLLLLPSRIYIHTFYIKCIISITLVHR